MSAAARSLLRRGRWVRARMMTKRFGRAAARLEANAVRGRQVAREVDVVDVEEQAHGRGHSNAPVLDLGVAEEAQRLVAAQRREFQRVEDLVARLRPDARPGRAERQRGGSFSSKLLAHGLVCVLATAWPLWGSGCGATAAVGGGAGRLGSSHGLDGHADGRLLQVRLLHERRRGKARHECSRGREHHNTWNRGCMRGVRRGKLAVRARVVSRRSHGQGRRRLIVFTCEEILNKKTIFLSFLVRAVVCQSLTCAAD